MMPLMFAILLFASSAYAFDDPCAKMERDAAIKCYEFQMKRIELEIQQENRRYYQEQAERDREMQRDIARQQAQGLMLFGTGPALIDGMNRNLDKLQLPTK